MLYDPSLGPVGADESWLFGRGWRPVGGRILQGESSYGDIVHSRVVGIEDFWANGDLHLLLVGVYAFGKLCINGGLAVYLGRGSLDREVDVMTAMQTVVEHDGEDTEAFPIAGVGDVGAHGRSAGIVYACLDDACLGQRRSLHEERVRPIAKVNIFEKHLGTVAQVAERPAVDNGDTDTLVAAFHRSLHRGLLLSTRGTYPFQIHQHRTTVAVGFGIEPWYPVDGCHDFGQ